MRQTEWIGLGVLGFEFEIIWLLIVSDFVPSDSAFCLAVVSRLDIRNSSCEQLALVEKRIAQQDQGAAP